MTLRWTATALRDLGALHDYIAADNLAAASETVENLLSGIDTLERHPEMGRKGRITGTRELVASHFIVVYRVRRTVIELLAIIHGARKWPDSL
jgi:addiction module RelE/StbE family toxin